MANTKESDLTVAFLLYVIRCLAEGDLLTLRQMNVSERDIETLRKLNIADLFLVKNFRVHCLNIQLNQAIFHKMLEFMHERRLNENSLQKLLQYDAPRGLVEYYFGLSNREFTQRRRSFEGLTTMGRTKEPNEEETDQLLERWLNINNRDESGRLSEPEEYLTLAKELGISVRSIWMLTERWIEMGLGRRKRRRGKSSFK